MIESWIKRIECLEIDDDHNKLIFNSAVYNYNGYNIMYIYDNR